MGIYLSDHDHDCLTNLRFAGDVLLFATSKEQLRKMVYEFKESTEKVGLRIHPGKTKVLSNQSSTSLDSQKEMQIGDVKIEILTRSESVRYLGQLITFQHQETTEIKNRIRTAWATFHKYRQELTSKNYLLKHRLRLFDAAITPTICYPSRTLIRAVLMTRAETDKAQSLTTTRTVTCHSRVITMKRLMLQRSNKRNGLNTLKGAPLKLWKRWKMII